MVEATLTLMSELTALTAEDATPSDTILVDDISVTDDKKMTLAELVEYVNDTLISEVDIVTATDASYALPANTTTLVLNNGSTDIDITFASVIPTGAKVEIFAINNGATSHTVTLSGSQTFDGTNGIATFDAADESITIRAISATRVIVLANEGAVAFSS